jgi:hypothetical protein
MIGIAAHRLLKWLSAQPRHGCGASFDPFRTGEEPCQQELRRSGKAAGTSSRAQSRRRGAKSPDDDLKKVEGDYDRTVGLIKERTGEKMEEIHKKIDGCCGSC